MAGLGGSAGSLEAFEDFFRNLPPDTGAAYVIIMHLDPSKKGFLPEVVQRFTRMPVVQAENGMKVEPDHVYVIRPNTYLSIAQGKLELLEPEAPQGFRMPIDYFFRSLADDMKELSIGIVFSGMGTDGTLGVRAINEKMGLVMVQDPADTKFDSMPKSAIGTGLADYVAPTKDLPKYLVDYVHSIGQRGERPADTGKISSALDKILLIVRNRTGHDFFVYKQDTIIRRIERRMTVHRITNLSDYVRYLKENVGEIDQLNKELLIGVTRFFRDPKAFETLEGILCKYLDGKPEDTFVRVWVPGCSTGEEAYSIAIIIDECLGARRFKVQIFATDIDEDAIEKARKGVYPDNIAADVSGGRLKKFFVSEDGHYRVKKDIRDMVVFAEQDVITDPPFTNMDLISCRNLLIYLKPEAQEKVLTLFTYALNPGGILFLGPSESVNHQADAFTTLDSRWKIFRRKEYVSKREIAVSIPTGTPYQPERAVARGKHPEINLAEVARHVLLENFSPPAMLVNGDGDIIYINGQIGKYLEPVSGKASMNIYAMIRRELRTDIGMAVDKALRDKKEIKLARLEFSTDGKRQAVNIIVRPVNGAEYRVKLLLVVFEDVEQPLAAGKIPKKARPSDDRCRKLEEQLDMAKQRLQANREETNASQEELRSMNEELQSTNEELQSTNEELTTSKEEMQSLNEELSTVNSELHAKIDDLTSTSNDMRNLLNSTKITTIFLDNDLKIKRFTPEVTKLVNLINSDLGRPITDISTSFIDEDLVAEAKKVSETLIPLEQEVQVKEGGWFMMRITPYRSMDNVIEGVVITFSDITGLKSLEISLRDARDYAEDIVQTVREPLLVLDDRLNVGSANESFYKSFKVSPGETVGHSLFELGNGQWNIPDLKKLLEIVLPEKKELRDYRVEHDFPGIGHKVMLLNARMLHQTKSNGGLILLAIEDVTGSHYNELPVFRGASCQRFMKKRASQFS